MSKSKTTPASGKPGYWPPPRLFFEALTARRSLPGPGTIGALQNGGTGFLKITG
jgi:hypothetical protein